MNKIARIAYTNTEPFFHFWDSEQFPLSSGVPRVLALAAKDNDIAAGPLPVVECWNLEKTFFPLGNWGIAAQERCRSVFVFSRRPFSELDQLTIGVTRESSTSVALCSVLIQEKYGHSVHLRRGLEPQDDAWLVIGDQALKMAYSPSQLVRWTHVTDLATEWWNWQKLPFVFAQWVARINLDPAFKNRLNKHIQYAYHQGQVALEDISIIEGERLGLSSELIHEYLKGFMYELSTEAIRSMAVFREMVAHLQPDVVAGRR